MCDTKVCSKCGQELPVSEFNKNKTNKDGLQNMCKRCAKEYIQSNKELLMKYHKKYEQANKERKRLLQKNNKHRRMLHDAKRRAKLKD
jgi:superfamily II helicase